VQPAAIAHQEPARLGGDEVAEWRDPVLERHRCANDTTPTLRRSCPCFAPSRIIAVLVPSAAGAGQP